jgi:hypothetical protein
MLSMGLLFSLVYVAVYLPNHWQVDGNHRASLSGMVEGTACRPFVFRRLLPMIVRGLRVPLSDRQMDRLEEKMLDSRMIRALADPKRANISRDYLFEGVTVFALIYISLIGYAVVLGLFAYRMFPGCRPAVMLSPTVGILMLPPFFAFHYLYDIPQLFLFSLGLYLIYREKMITFILVFTLGCLNKETSVLLLIPFWIHFFGKLPLPRLIGFSVLQVVIFLVIKLTLGEIYEDNPGNVMEIFIAYQWREMMHGFSRTTLVAVLGALFAVCYRWAEKPLFAREALWIGFPLLTLYFVGGCPGELRVFFELFPALTLLYTHSLLKALDEVSAERPEFGGTGQGSGIGTRERIDRNAGTGEDCQAG